MKGWREGRFALFCWRAGFSLYKVVASSLIPSHLPSLWFSGSRTMVKALEILETSVPSAPDEMPPIRFSLLVLLRALALKKPALSSHHLHTEDKKIAMNLHNKTMAWTRLSQGKSMGNQPKLSELPWNHSGSWALNETSRTWSIPWAACVARLGSANQPIFTELSQWGCSPGLEFSGELPPFIHLQLPSLDLPQLVLAQAEVPPSKSVLSSFWVVTLGYAGPGTNLWQSTRPAEMSGFSSSRACVLQAVLLQGDFCDSSILQGTMSILQALS